jgi:hypothetical protein
MRPLRLLNEDREEPARGKARRIVEEMQCPSEERIIML